MRHLDDDRNLVRLWDVKSLSLEEYKKRFGDTPEDIETYNNLKNSKEGYITIDKTTHPFNHEEGITAAFGEGISCYMSTTDRWYSTSVIRKIDWEKGEFETLNSVYKFTFTEEK